MNRLLNLDLKGKVAIFEGLNKLYEDSKCFFLFF